MIIVQDNYLDQDIFNDLQEYCDPKKFNIVKVGDKEFSVLETPQDILPYFQMEGFDIVLSFIRSAYIKFDTDLRIHADNIINNRRIDSAVVFYINKKKGVTKNGTHFYEHVDYGMKLPKDISDEDFNNILLSDSNNMSKWIKTDFIQNVPNRLLLYDASYFHSKFPKIIRRGTRMVLVVFYARSIAGEQS